MVLESGKSKIKALEDVWFTEGWLSSHGALTLWKGGGNTGSFSIMVLTHYFDCVDHNKLC